LPVSKIFVELWSLLRENNCHRIDERSERKSQKEMTKKLNELVTQWIDHDCGNPREEQDSARDFLETAGVNADKYGEQFCQDGEQMEANARLMAAAPDLLIATKELLEMVEMVIRAGYAVTGDVPFYRAAIAKAEGQFCQIFDSRQNKEEKLQPNTCRVTFGIGFATTEGETMILPFRHFCGGSSVKLPRHMADFRRQWVTLEGLAPNQILGRTDVRKIEFGKFIKHTRPGSYGRRALRK
jgi:hypothetical protein